MGLWKQGCATKKIVVIEKMSFVMNLYQNKVRESVRGRKKLVRLLSNHCEIKDK